MLPSEENSKLKLADILLSATLSFKLPAEANSVICSVAFLLRDHADEEIATTVSDAIIDKVIDKISIPLGALNESVSAAKEFLDATLQKHASELLELQDSTKQQAELVKSFTEASANLAQNHNPQGLADAAWPQLTGSNHHPPLGCPVIPQHRGNTQADPKVIQRVSLAAKQLLIEYGPLDDGEPPHPRRPMLNRSCVNDLTAGSTITTSQNRQKDSPHQHPHVQSAMYRSSIVPPCFSSSTQRSPKIYSRKWSTKIHCCSMRSIPKLAFGLVHSR